MPENEETKLYISKVELPDNGGTFYIKDEEARAAMGLHFVRSTNAGNTPKGVTWDDDGTLITGTLEADDAQDAIYLVPSKNGVGKDVFDEYVRVLEDGAVNYFWEKLGDTDIDFDDLQKLVKTVTVSGTSANVLGAGATFQAPQQTVSVTAPTASVVQSVSPTSTKLVTANIKPAGADVTVSVVSSVTNYSATYVTFNPDVTAHYVTATSHNVSYIEATNTSASRITSSPSVTFTPVAGQVAACDISYDASAAASDLNKVVYRTYVENETLKFGRAAVTHASVATAATQSITAVQSISYSAISASYITSNVTHSVDSVSLTARTVPQIAGAVTHSVSAVATEQKVLTEPAADTVAVATGAVSTNGAGAVVVTGVTSTPTNVVASVTGTVPSHNITVTNKDQKTAVTSVTTTATKVDSTTQTSTYPNN